MIRFTGNKSLGTWMYRDRFGVFHVMTPNEIAADDKVVIWKEDAEAGDFFWPHVELGNKLVPMMYDERKAE